MLTFGDSKVLQKTVPLRAMYFSISAANRTMFGVATTTGTEPVSSTADAEPSAAAAAFIAHGKYITQTAMTKINPTVPHGSYRCRI